MRKIKFEKMKKMVLLSLVTVMTVSTGAYAVEQTWGDIADKVTNTPDNVTLENNITTDGTALNLGAPPVPGGFNINGNGHTITAGAGTESFIINNAPTAITNITNTNFTGGNVTTNGGAIQNSATLTVKGTDGNKSTFSNNTSGNGGAIYNSGAGTVSLDNTAFNNNNATVSGSNKGYGGAIYNDSTNAGASLTVTNSSFNNNKANNYGGAIANLNGNANIISSSFTENEALNSDGGAIFNRANMTISSSVFSKNTASTSGGAILNGLGASATNALDISLTISNTVFDRNFAISTGGAITNTGNSSDKTTTLTIKEGTVFTNNGYKDDKVTSSGGAILNNNRPVDGAGYTDGVLVIDGTANSKVYFKGNIASDRGGAITNYGKANINNAIFEANGTNAEAVSGSKTSRGGAIYNSSQTGNSAELTVRNSSFVNNTARTGGAVYNDNTTATFIDTDFVGNKADGNSNGGAVYGAKGSTSTFIAQNRDMYIGNADSVTNNTDSIALIGSKDPGTGAITKATGNFAAHDGRTLNINSVVTGSKSGNDFLADVNINKTATDGTAYNGTVRVNGDAKIQNANISLYNGMLAFAHDRNLDSSNILNLYGGTLNVLNNEFGSYQLQAKELNLLGNSNIMADVDLKNEKMDSIIGTNFGKITNDGGFNLNVSGMKSFTEAVGGSAKVLFTDAPELIGHVSNNGATTIEAPINKYSVTQVTQNVGGNPLGDNGEYFLFNKIGNSDSVITGAVAAQGAFLLMDNIYRQSFANMDMVTLMTPEQRMAWKMRNKYAAAYHTGVYAPYVIPEERDGIYVRPSTNFENVPLKNGPRVSNVSFGTLIGGDSDLIELGHGWDGNFSLFGAYSGSHQTYNGVSIWQNAGTFGGVATAYKGNFWTGFTANVGASAAEATNNFGSEQFPILMSGAAWKSGYNWGLFNNKFIIQPNYMMSYTFVNVFDYTNAAGVSVTQDPLNAIEIIPGIRLIGNLKNGWQPYLAANVTWNIMDKTKFFANEVALTPLAVKPYVEYGLGVQKRWGNRFTGFGQCMFRNGGRNGVAFTLGLRWALGN